MATEHSFLVVDKCYRSSGESVRSGLNAVLWHLTFFTFWPLSSYHVLSILKVTRRTRFEQLPLNSVTIKILDFEIWLIEAQSIFSEIVCRVFFKSIPQNRALG